MENPRTRAIEESMKEQAELKKKREGKQAELRKKIRESWAKKKGKWEKNIGCSLWVSFKPHDKKLIMKMFEFTLDDYIKRAKKSHRIKLICLWKNMGCYKKGEAWGGGPTSVRTVKKRG